MVARSTWTPFVVAALAALGSGCSGRGSDGTAGTNDNPAENGATAAVSVAVALYPIEEIVRRVGGDLVEVVALTPPGANSHDVEVSGKTLDRLSESDAVFYLGEGFQPSVEDAVEQLPDSVVVVDLLTADGLSTITSVHADEHGDEHSDESDDEHEHSHGDSDPHVWLDPTNMIHMARAVESVLIGLLPDATTAVSENTAAYVAELDALGVEMDAAVGSCASTTVVTSHEAFGHLFARLGLEGVAITGLDPQQQPSARQLDEIAGVARAAGVTTVYVDATVSARYGETIAGEIGAEVSVLDPVESITADDRASGVDYASLQRGNLAALVEGLDCR